VIRLIISPLLLLSALFFPTLSNSQTIVINEVSSANTTFPDEDGDLKDWIELYNASEVPISLTGWSITDNSDQAQQWIFPTTSIAAKDFELVFASGKNRTKPLSYRTLLKQGSTCNYLIPNSSTSNNWRAKDFNDNSWKSGVTGLGYGDGDDATIVPSGTRSIFLRQSFEIEDPTLIEELLLHVDYDDGFAAFINGVEVLRVNLLNTSVPPSYNASALDNREAEIYEGGTPEKFVIEEVADLLTTGKNVLAIQVHNVSSNSSDLSIIPYLSVGTIQPIDGEQIPDILDLSKQFLHTNFKLSGGETLYLFDETGSLQDSLVIPSLDSGRTAGRYPDGTAKMLLIQELIMRALQKGPSYFLK